MTKAALSPSREKKETVWDNGIGLGLTENSVRVLMNRYLKKDESGVCIETPEDMFRRVARAVAAGESAYGATNATIRVVEDVFYTMMVSGQFMPNSPTLMNAGREMGMLSACFVLPVPDSIDGIFDSIKATAMIQKAGGGTGFAFDRLRPTGDYIKSSGGTTSGPISFWKVFSEATNAIQQGAFRRGANMGMMRCLSGDTLINTLGGFAPLKTLVGTRPYVYACDPTTRKVHVVQADSVFVSDTDREMVRVHLDDDRHIDCTPDHRFMLSDGSFMEAGKMATGVSLMAFEHKLHQHGSASRFVRTIACTGGRAQYEHRVVAADVLGAETSYQLQNVHHVDENSVNNHPSNLRVLSRSEHASIHKDGGLLLAQRQTAARRRGKRLEDVYPLEKVQIWKQRMREAALARNHKVLKIEKIAAAEKVYDISLPSLHNFAAEGVFVHNCDHPDILKFIFAKQDLRHFQNYNISVKITDNWMEMFKLTPNGAQVVSNYRTKQQYVLPKELDIHSYQLQDLVKLEDYKDGKFKNPVWTMKDIWDTIVHNAWATGEPGVIFIDRINQFNPTPNVGEIEACNPCGEQPLLPFEACNLGSVNLGKFVSSTLRNDKDKMVDWDSLRTCIRHSIRFLEDVVEVNNYVIPEIAKVCTENRKIGLGVMGFADALFKLDVGYNTPDGIAWGEKFMKFVNDESHAMSEQLATERGCFKNWEGSRWQTQWKRKQRNACSTTVAPTGTISIITNCSGGIEPLFSLAFYREVMRDHLGKPVKMLEVNDVFRFVAKEAGFWGYDEQELFDKIATDGTLHNLERIPQNIRDVFVCAHDIAPEWHVGMQAAFQRHCDSAISKTTNFPNTATPKEVEEIYMQAYASGCKGVTVYRDGCRKGQPMALKEVKKVEPPVIVAPVTRRAPEVIAAVRIRQATPFGHMHVNITVDVKTDQELEVFAQLGKAGDVAASDLEAICRMVSLYLRSGGNLLAAAKQLEGIGSSLSIPTKDGRILSLGDALGTTIKKYLAAKKKHGIKSILLGECDVESQPVQEDQVIKHKYSAADEAMAAFKLRCPECSVGTLTFLEGCKKCVSCGYSAC